MALVNDTTFPRVSVQMITYNHAPYIAQAIEGVMAQKTNFTFELVISDDCSSDGTREICRQYAERYPDKIKLLLPEKNLGMSANAALCMANCKGEYIAICEGDDYWTEPFKLQKQVDFLDMNAEYAFCCHRFKCYNQENGTWSDDYAALYYKDGEDLEITRKLFFQTWITHPLTTVYRRSMRNLTIESKYKNFRDIHLFYSLLKRGKGISFNSFMGVYRMHMGGVSSKVDKVKNHRTQWNIYYSLWKRNWSDVELTKILAIKSIVMIKLLFMRK